MSSVIIEIFFLTLSLQPRVTFPNFGKSNNASHYLYNSAICRKWIRVAKLSQLTTAHPNTNSAVETTAFITKLNYVKKKTTTNRRALCLKVWIKSSTVTGSVNGHRSVSGSSRYDVLLPARFTAPRCLDWWYAFTKYLHKIIIRMSTLSQPQISPAWKIQSTVGTTLCLVTCVCVYFPL